MPKRRVSLNRGGAPGNLAGISVLVVDDNPTNRRILEKTLEAWEMQPILAPDGPSAIQTLRRAAQDGAPFPLLLLDAQMPGLDGFATAAAVAEDNAIPAPAMLMLSSYGQRGDVDRCKEMGISGYLTKPVRQIELQRAILGVLGLQEANRGERKVITRHALAEVFRTLHVLLAEDNQVNRELAVRILTKRGHKVTAVANGKLAIEAARTGQFDVILMDMQMPETDGVEATRAIRSDERRTGKHVPIVALTAHAMQGDRERYIAVGMDGYLAKPIKAEELLRMTERLANNPGPIDTSGDSSAAAAFDKKLALERMDGDESLLLDLAMLFIEESPRLIAAIEDAVLRKDAPALERSAHSLKGSVSAFAARDAFETALALEKIGRSGDLSGAEAAFSLLADEIRRLRAALGGMARAHEEPLKIESHS